MNSERGLDSQTIKRRATTGIATLLGRQAAAQIINLVATTLLLRILAVEEFGIYAIALFVVTLGRYFADAGLGSALVQRKEEITQEDLNVVFTVQSALLGLATLCVWIIAPWIQQQYHLPSYAADLLRLLSLSLLIASFKSVPAIILERRLDYPRLSAADITETVVFQTVAIVLALAGLHVWSFAVAAVIQSSVSSLVLYFLCPWKPGISFRLRRASALLRFGLLVQGRTLISVVKDNITPTLIAFLGGPLAVGYVNFAMKLASYPLQIEAVTSRVAFPAYSRIQEDVSRLQSAIEKTLKLVNLVLFPLTGMLVVLAEPVTHLVFGDKWLPALPALYMFSLANLTAGTSNVLVTSLYALGRPGTILKLSLFWACGSWVLAAPLALCIGWMGLPVAVLLLSVTVLLPIHEVRKSIPVDVVTPLTKPALAALLAVAVAIAVRLTLGGTLPAVLLIVAVGGIVYTTSIILLDGRWLGTELLSSLPPSLSARLRKTPLGGYLLVPHVDRSIPD
jgi:PST family polysaccharide transporter